HALAELDRFYDDVQGRAAPTAELTPSLGPLDLAAAPTPAAMCQLSGMYIDDAQRLGRRPAGLHLALASDTAAPAFAPEPFTKDDVARVAADAIGQLQSVRGSLGDGMFDRLARRLHLLRDGQNGQPLRLST